MDNKKRNKSSALIEGIINCELEEITKEYTLPTRPPEATILENKTEIIIQIRLFGFDPKQVFLMLEGETVVIEGKIKPPTTKKKQIKVFSARVRLPWFCDFQKISAKGVENGIEICVPKKEECLTEREIKVYFPKQDIDF